MTSKSKGQSLLENAYKLESPDDNEVYYNAFAETYDSDFAEALGYEYPSAIARIYRETAHARDVPIADIGCGTGLVAEALAADPQSIDGIDISDAMLATAKGKSLYRQTLKVDLTADLDAFANSYGAVVSAGTFTSGHLGPGSLQALLGIARPGAQFVIGVNKAFYLDAGFDPVCRALERSGAIFDLSRDPPC